MSKRDSVVTAFVQMNEKILVLRRSDDVKTYTGQWAAVSGYLEQDSPLEQAYEELREEVNLIPDELQLIKKGEPMKVNDDDLRWEVHPFLFQLNIDKDIKLDREHTKYRWINPEKLNNLDTVPKLEQAWERLK